MFNTFNPRRRARALVAAVGATALALTACSGDGDEETTGSQDLGLINDGTLVVAMSGALQPSSYFDGNDLTGFDYDIGVANAQELGLEPDHQHVAVDTLIGDLQANLYVLLIASMTPTEERDQAVDFTDSYDGSGAQAVVSSDSE